MRKRIIPGHPRVQILIGLAPLLLLPKCGIICVQVTVIELVNGSCGQHFLQVLDSGSWTRLAKRLVKDWILDWARIAALVVVP